MKSIDANRGSKRAPKLRKIRRKPEIEPRGSGEERIPQG